MPDCIFCQMIAGEMESDFIYEDKQIVAFRDINPQAPVHILLVPREHIPDLVALKDQHAELVGHIHLTAVRLAEREGIAEEGFRVVANCRDNGGQTVDHIHFHLLGGRNMGWPPG